MTVSEHRFSIATVVEMGNPGWIYDRRKVMSKEVWIIGVDPPCPRCDLTRQRAERVAKEMGLPVNVRNLIYSDFEAREFAKSVGRELGTAKHVVEKAGIEMDWNHVASVVKNPPSQPEDIDTIDGRARRWSAEMD